MGQVHCIVKNGPHDFEIELAERVDALFNYFLEEHCEETAAVLTSCTVQMMQLAAIERGRLPPP